ncbi:MAG: hypothetical protein RIR52_1647 [Acidobacteriota bacterium]|jgi:hypothetical protein
MFFVLSICHKSVSLSIHPARKGKKRKDEVRGEKIKVENK